MNSENSYRDTRYIVKTWLSQGSQFLSQCDVTRRQRTNEGSHIVYITEKVVRQHAHNTTFGLYAAARLFRETCRLRIH